MSEKGQRALNELDVALTNYKKTIVGMPMTQYDVAARFILYASLMKEYGIETKPYLDLAKKVHIDVMQVQHNPSQTAH